MRGALAATEALWQPLWIVSGWVRRVGWVLANPSGEDADWVRAEVCRVLAEMEQSRLQTGELGGAVDHFLAVTQRYWPRLFACYAVPGMPRTNNDLEQYFGAGRHHERRATGRKKGGAALSRRGCVRLVAWLGTRLGVVDARRLQPTDLHAYRRLRQQLAQLQQRRAVQTRFRRDPAAYLANLEANYHKLPLPH